MARQKQGVGRPVSLAERPCIFYTSRLTDKSLGLTPTGDSMRKAYGESVQLRGVIDMPRTQRVAEYIQRLAYESLFHHDRRDERPEDVLPRAESSPSYPSWSATSFSDYVPFRGPTNG